MWARQHLSSGSGVETETALCRYCHYYLLSTVWVDIVTVYTSTVWVLDIATIYRLCRYLQCPPRVWRAPPSLVVVSWNKTPHYSTEGGLGWAATDQGLENCLLYGRTKTFFKKHFHWKPRVKVRNYENHYLSRSSTQAGAQMIILDMKYKHYEISTIIYQPALEPGHGWDLELLPTPATNLAWLPPRLK